MRVFQALHIFLCAIFPAISSFLLFKKTESLWEKLIAYHTCDEIFGNYAKGDPTLNDELGMERVNVVVWSLFL